ncbi:MAG: hypothetical protein ABIP48_31855, partial [Planctomycetota bacterium]
PIRNRLHTLTTLRQALQIHEKSPKTRPELGTKIPKKPISPYYCGTSANVVDRIREVDPWRSWHSGSLADPLATVKCKVKA